MVLYHTDMRQVELLGHSRTKSNNIGSEQFGIGTAMTVAVASAVPKDCCYPIGVVTDDYDCYLQNPQIERENKL